MLYDVKTGDPSPVTEEQLQASWDGRQWPPFPNLEPKQAGDYVRNVHPCGHSDEEGVVLQVSGTYVEGDTLTVATGIGGTSYGPAQNWRTIEARPAWLHRAIDDRNERAIALLAAVEATRARRAA